MKKFIITEEERKHILGLYGLIKEEIDPKVGGTITVKNFYPAGFYTVTKEMGEQIVNQLKPVIDFVRTNPDSIVDILLVSQESAIPNYDNEGLKGKSWLDEGKLSEFRQEYLNTFFQNYFNQLKTTNFIKDSVETPQVRLKFEEPTTPFEGSFCPANATTEQKRGECYRKWKAIKKSNTTEYQNLKSKYDTEQNSEILITVKRKEEKIPPPTTTKKETPTVECIKGLTIRVSVERHSCQNAEFFIFANQTLLTNTKGGITANLNTGTGWIGVPNSKGKKLPAEQLNPSFGQLPNGDETVSYDGTASPNSRRSDTFVINETQAKSILEQGNGYITIYMIATTTKAHRDIQRIEIIRDGKTLLDTTVRAERSKLLTLSGCGNEIVKNPAPEPTPPGEGLYNGVLTRLLSTRKPMSAKEQKEKAGQQDAKQLMLETVLSLTERIFDLKEYIQNYKDTDYTEYYNRLKGDYNYFIEALNKGYGNMPFTKNSEGEYKSKEIRKGKDAFYGDIKLDLDNFYAIFDAIYIKGKSVDGKICVNDYNYSDTGRVTCKNVPDKKGIFEKITRAGVGIKR